MTGGRVSRSGLAWRCLGVAMALPPAMAQAADEVWRCTLEGTAVRFAFDRADLAPGIRGEPPRRALGHAEVGRARLRPEVFTMPDGTVGFHEDAGAVGQKMLVIAPDGAARYSDTGSNLSLQGRCARIGG